MKKKVFQNGTLKSKAYFMNGNVKQEVEEAVYEGTTPLSAENLNDMQDNIEEEINSVSSNLLGLINGKLENYIVKTNDSKFDDVTQIIGDNYEDGKVYLITNSPVSDNNYIQSGATHSVIGMQYGNKSYGQQISFSIAGVKFRTKNNNVWGQWQCLTRDSVSFPILLNGWEEYISNANKIEKNNNIVTLMLALKSGTAKTVCQLPAGFRPEKFSYHPITNLTKREASVFSISRDGFITLEGPEVGNTIFANISFIAGN